MGVRHTVDAGGLLYTVVDDLTGLYQAVITAGLVDEVTGKGLLVTPQVSVDLPGLGVNVNEDSLFAVTGTADQVFPKLATTPYVVQLAIRAPGYRDQNVTVNVPIASTFPIALGAIKMRPLPVRVQGRVVKQLDRSPIAGASVGSSNGKIPALRTPVYFDHPAGVFVNALALTPAGPARKLMAAVTGGGNTLILDTNAGLGPTQILQIGPVGSEDICAIASIGPQPSEVILANGLNSSFPVNSPVQELTAGAPLGTTKLSRDSNQGDGLLILLGALAGSFIEIVDGVKTEYHSLNAVTDALGYYHLNGVTGVSSLALKGSASGFTSSTQTVFIVYHDPVNVVDFRLKP